MLDTSHSPIGPCGPLEQSSGDNFRHAPTALLSSSLDFDLNTGVGWDGGETVGLSSKFRDGYNDSMSRFYNTRQGSGLGEIGECAFSHAPPLQEFGEMLARIRRNMVQSPDVKRICTCWCIVLVACVYSTCICVSLYRQS